MTFLRRSAIALAAASLFLLALAPRAHAAPLNANAQDHCNISVCVGAESLGGSGPDILNAQVETRGKFPVPLHTVFYLLYGSSPTAAKKAIPRTCISNDPNMYGCDFGIGRTLNKGWVLCGEISRYAGYPCITIG